MKFFQIKPIQEGHSFGKLKLRNTLLVGNAKFKKKKKNHCSSAEDTDFKAGLKIHRMLRTE